MSSSKLLTELKRGQYAQVLDVRDQYADDSIAQRLRSLGFVPGERVRLQTWGPLGREPLLIQIGSTRFALRHAEADRVVVECEAAA